MSETWTIGELAERAAGLLGAGPRHNGRVRDVPNARLIRWYTTIGLLDPPLARRGRVALYGRRHLLQLVAIKCRQAEGLSIAAIQAELAGATDGMLERVSGLSGSADTSTDHAVDAAGGAPEDFVPLPAGTGRRTARPERFWTRPSPAPAEPGEPPPRALVDDPAPIDGPGGSVRTPIGAGDVRPAAGLAPIPVDVLGGYTRDPLRPHAPVADLVYGVRLAPGVTVILDSAARTPTDHDLAALREAAAPLIADLVARGLATAPGSSTEGS
ncbi:helix-turn-helix domain-containing protein [Microtetraspora glauca]|uniref:Helix-turn-helix domain-containing protein n=1 Tax=Microtetraspora glauca TaxID=1996 RepID=A0ABV3GAZ7_MICGL